MKKWTRIQNLITTMELKQTSSLLYRVPRLLIKDERFKGLSSDAKLLYGLMLDRMSLSMKNGWLVMYVPSRSGKKPLTILTGSRKNSRQMRSVPLWIRRSLAGREPESTDFQRKDMADREAGSGKEQKKRVATNRIKMDLQS